MSNYCNVLICGICSGKNITDCLGQLKDTAVSLGIGIQCDGFYIEPFLHEIASSSGALLCNLSDNNGTTNCEKLTESELCPNAEPLQSRMEKIVAIVETSLLWSDTVELFIATSGDRYSDLSHVVSTPQKLYSILIEEMHQSNFFPAIHITVRK